MNSLVKRKQQWELQNYQLLQRLLQQTSDALMYVVVRAGQLISFLLFLTFVIGRGAVAIFWGILEGPQVVRVMAPNKYQQRHEFERPKDCHPPTWIL